LYLLAISIFADMNSSIYHGNLLCASILEKRKDRTI
jgi:hypothetical protein